MNTPTRGICLICQKNPQAVNYRNSAGITHYRSLCAACIRKGKKIKPAAPGWFKSGYRKKERCEKCNFKSRFPDQQLCVFYVDGNLRNNNWTNLKTICLNCQVEVYKSKLPWLPADIVPDF